MSEVHNDSEKLRTFGSQLSNFAGGVDEELNRLRGAMGRLSSSWRDQEFEEFVRQFTTTQERLKRLVEETKRVAPSLKRDADALDEYFRLQVPK